ncbi:MAG: ABC transporter permease subunit [Spirochaetaceae bacterium]|nr:MAG: ABC transporter permease subunit [Spirochaetaceae bacterium]
MVRRSGSETSRIPFWRDIRVLRAFVQFVFLAAVIALILWGISNYRQRGLIFSYSFLDEAASFDLAEGIEFEPTDTYARAFLVGVLNTVRVAVIGIVFATFLGLFTGIARLSRNWLVSKIARVYIEVIRNTPLLVQLFFLYFAVILKLPKLSEAVVLPGPAFLSNRGIVAPWPRLAQAFGLWWPFILAALAAAIVLIVIRRRTQARLGRPSVRGIWVFACLILIPLSGWFIVPGNPLWLDIPELLQRSGGVYKVEGGVTLSSEFIALLFGLVIYTGAYIAEVVRAGLQSVAKGQTEAARAQGFTNGQIMRLIVLPQALRVIIPPLISQYLNLTKNSSLAIAIGFLDLYAVSQTMLNQSGRVVEVFFMIMGSYLAISLTISLIMNIVNKRMQIVER